MRLSFNGIPRALKGGGHITFERHHRVGVPNEPALSVKIGAGPIVRLTIEQQTQLEDWLERPPISSGGLAHEARRIPQ